MDEKSTLQQFLNTRDMLNWIDMKISYLTVKPQREIHYRPDKTPVSNHRETQRFSLPWIRYLFVFWSMIRSKKKAPQSRFQRLNLKIPSRWSTDMCEFIQLRKKQFYCFYLRIMSIVMNSCHVFLVWMVLFDRKYILGMLSTETKVSF